MLMNRRPIGTRNVRNSAPDFAKSGELPEISRTNIGPPGNVAGPRYLRFPKPDVAASIPSPVLSLGERCRPSFLLTIPSTVSVMKFTIASVFLLATAFAMPAAGQLAAPNAAGVSLGHIHLYVSDVPAQQKFWAAMGGVPVANQRLEMIQFPGVFILLRRGETKGGTVGSIVNHIGFVWKDLPAAIAKWQAAGYKIEQNADPNHGYILGPDGIRLEFSGDPSLQVPVKINHVHFYPQDVPAMKAWYAKILGGVPGKCARDAARS